MKNNINQNNERVEERNYSYYSRILKKPFDSLRELKEAEADYYAELKAKEDKAATKKADAQKVEEAFKALNTTRRVYKESLLKLTEAYSADLKKLKEAFEADKKEIQDTKIPAVEANHGRLKIDLLARRFIDTTDSTNTAVTTPGIALRASFACVNVFFII
jgi:rRNA maturation endonuclease Nob1